MKLRSRSRLSFARSWPVAALAVCAVAVLAAAPESGGAPAAAAPQSGEHAHGSSHRDVARLLTMDHHLVQADFIGEVTVLAIRDARDGGVLADVHVEDTWYSRWDAKEQLTVGAASLENMGGLVQEGARLVVLLSGGPWTESALTFRGNSLFRVAKDGGLECVSGNPLFAVHNSGFVCSIQAYMPGAPISLAEMKSETLAMRGRAARRLPMLSSLLDRLRRPLMTERAEEIQIDRTAIENEVYR
jgi:hypothetical protein